MSPERSDDLDAAANRAAAIPGHELLKPVITRELLHYDLLHALQRDGHLEGKAFIGGTALRLAYAGNRFSEDLDFAAGPGFDGTRETGIGATLERAVGERYEGKVGVREKLRPLSLDGNAVSTWTVLMDTAPDRPDIPTVRVKVDISNVPSYTAASAELATNYEDVAPEHRGMRIATQSAGEIAADKVVSSIATFDRNHPRFRDLYDLTHLAARGETPSADLVRAKRSHHGDHLDDGAYAERRDRFLDQLPDMVRDPRFASEMSRFVPAGALSAMLRSERGLQVIENSVRAQVRAGTQFVDHASGHALGRAVRGRATDAPTSSRASSEAGAGQDPAQPDREPGLERGDGSRAGHEAEERRLAAMTSAELRAEADRHRVPSVERMVSETSALIEAVAERRRLEADREATQQAIHASAAVESEWRERHPGRAWLHDSDRVPWRSARIDAAAARRESDRAALDGLAEPLNEARAAEATTRNEAIVEAERWEPTRVHVGKLDRLAEERGEVERRDAERQRFERLEQAQRQGAAKTFGRLLTARDQDVERGGAEGQWWWQSRPEVRKLIETVRERYTSTESRAAFLEEMAHPSTPEQREASEGLVQIVDDHRQRERTRAQSQEQETDQGPSLER